MAYTRLNLKNGDVFNENHIKHIEDTFSNLLGETCGIIWEDGAFDVNTGALVPSPGGTGRRRSDFISIKYSIINLSNPINFYILAYDENKQFLSAKGWIGSTYYNVLEYVPSGTQYYRILVQTGDEKQDEYWTISTPNKANKSNEIIVDCNGCGDYMTLEEALANARDSATNHVIIRIRAGVYYPAPKTPDSLPYNEYRRNLSIIGDNKNKVVLMGDIGYYYYQIGVDHAPIRIGGNVTIENITIKSNSSKYIETAEANGWDLSLPHCRAYCIHLDHSCNPGDEIVVKNCRLINDHFTTIGFGLKQDYTLRIENCDLITTTLDDTLSGFSNYGTLYGHLGDGGLTGQRLEVINCRITNVGYGTAINLMDGSGAENPEASYLLIGNVCNTNESDSNAKFKVVNKGWTQDKLCFGNNVEDMNA